MIEVMQVTTQQVSNGQLVTGWHFDPIGGWYYLDIEGQKWYGNPVTAQLLVPMAFIPKYEYPATSIGGPIAVVKGSNVKVNWSFSWQGTARTIKLRMGGCVKVLANYDEIGASVVRQDVPVTTSSTPKTYSGSTVFPFQYSVTTPKHLFILAEGMEYEVVYRDAFAEAVAEFQNLKIVSYSKV